MASLSPSDVRYQNAHIHDNKSTEIIVACGICLTAAYSAVVLRFVSRRVGKTPLEADDYTIVAALILTTGFVASVLISVHYGLGRHAITLKDPVSFAKSVLALEVIYNPAIVLTKTSILLLYRRLFPSRRFRYFLWSVGIFVVCYSITAATVNIFQCVPVKSDWDPRVEPRCVNIGLDLIILSSINVVTDASILCLPIQQIWQLQMSMTRKLQIAGLFLLGSLVCIISIVRAIYIGRVSITDGSWVDTKGGIWSVAETCVAVVSACLPTFRPLFSKAVRNRNAITPPVRSDPSSQKSRNKFGIRMTTFKSSWTGNSSGDTQLEESGSFARLADGRDLENS